MRRLPRLLGGAVVFLTIASRAVRGGREVDYDCGSATSPSENLSMFSDMPTRSAAYLSNLSDKIINVQADARVQIVAESSVLSKGHATRALVHIIPDVAFLPIRCSQQASNSSLWLIARRVEGINGTAGDSSSPYGLVSRSGIQVNATLAQGIWHIAYATCGRDGDEFNFSVQILCQQIVVATKTEGLAESSAKTRTPSTKGGLATWTGSIANETTGRSENTSAPVSNKTMSSGTKSTPLIGVDVTSPLGFISVVGPVVALIALLAFAFRRRFWRFVTGARKVNLQGIRADFDLVENPLSGWGEDDDDHIVSGPLSGQRIGSPTNRRSMTTQSNAAAAEEYFSLETPR